MAVWTRVGRSPRQVRALQVADASMIVLSMAMHLSAASHQGQNVSCVEYTTDVMVETVQHDLVPCRIWFRSQPTCANGRLDVYH